MYSYVPSAHSTQMAYGAMYHKVQLVLKCYMGFYEKVKLYQNGIWNYVQESSIHMK